ncbi:hypothetical protein PHMEG_00016366 [Phytophthora megakarya]|uniref:RNase H type-1 domain-containing protein n=1 Tax=Phytophthora megakarya TaxID=4795 RepID=A0A225W042_9STRA|nr:hypothetical protein PHMEG_00016366 [Phytophthora megakarya]
MLDSDFEGYVLSFDGAAKVSTRQGSCGCILWRLPGWHVLSAHGFLLVDVTQQAQGFIGCHQPNLERCLAEYEALKTKFASVRLVHVKRDYNQAADYLTTNTLALGKAWLVEDADELMHLKVVSRIPEKGDSPNDSVSDPRPRTLETMTHVRMATTRSRSRQSDQVDGPSRVEPNVGDALISTRTKIQS